MALDVFRLGQAAEQGVAHERAQDGEDQAGRGGHANDDRGLRTHRLVGLHGRIQDAHVAHLAGADQLELLRVVEQRRVQLGVDAHVTHQAHHVLFQIGQLLDVVAQAVDVAGQGRDLTVDAHDARVRRRKTRDQFLALLAQFHHASLRIHRLPEDQLGLFAQVDRAALVAQLVVLGFRGVQLGLQLRQLLLQEHQRLLGLGRLAVHVLLHVFLADLVQHRGRQRRIVALQGDADHARRTPALKDAQVRLHVLDGRQARAARHGELGARTARQRVHMHVHGAAARQQEAFGLAHRAGERCAGQLVAERVAAFAQRGQAKRLAQPFVGHVQLRDRDGLAAPRIAAARQAGRIRQAFIALRKPLAHHGEIARLGVDVEQEFVDRGTDDHARTQHFHFAGRFRLGIEHRRHIAQQASRLPVRKLLLDLHDDVSRIDRRRHHHVGQRAEKRKQGDRNDHPAVGKNGVHVGRQGGFLLTGRY